MDLLITFFYLLAVAGLSFEIAEGHLPNTVKKLLGLDKERKWMVTYSKIKNYWRVLPWWMWIIPIVPIVIFLIIIFLFLIRQLIYLINCTFCLSYHGSWMILLFSVDYTLHQ